MTYTGELVMPTSYVEVAEEEMTYLTGGTAAMLCKNLQGLWNKTKNIRYALKIGGISWGTILNSAKWSYGYAIAMSGKFAGAIALASRIVAVIAGLGAIAGITYLWNRRAFY